MDSTSRDFIARYVAPLLLPEELNARNWPAPASGPAESGEAAAATSDAHTEP